MTKITTLDLSPFYRASIGVDRLFDRIVNQIDTTASTNYPPYNQVKTGANTFEIQVAVAGFTQGELEVNIHDAQLIVTGENKTNPNKIILATGDTDQNKPVNILSTEFEHKEYAYHCISCMFPNQIRLKINKRLNNDEDRKRTDDIKRDTFNENIPFRKTIQTYFKFTDQPSENNISYRNEVAADVSATKRKLLNKTGEYEFGEKICVQNF
jgi:hypothetical protein